MNFDVLVIQSSLVVSPHFLGCPHMSPRIHPGHLLLTHSLKTSREYFVPNLEGLALRSEGLCVMSFHIPTTKSRKPRSFLPLGFVSSANWSHFIHSPTNNLLMYQTPYKEMTHLSNTSCSLYLGTVCDHSSSTSSSVPTKLLPNSQMHPAPVHATLSSGIRTLFSAWEALHSLRSRSNRPAGYLCKMELFIPSPVFLQNYS